MSKRKPPQPQEKSPPPDADATAAAIVLPPEASPIARPWDQLDGEPDLWFNRFYLYLQLGVKRTYAAAYRKECALSKQAITPGGHNGWSKNAEKWRWADRCRLHDEHRRKSDDVVQAIRRNDLRDIEWEMGQQLRDRVADMLKFPLMRQTQVQNETGTTIIIEPADWSYSDLIHMAEVASKLLRNSADESLGKVEVQTTSGNDDGADASLSDMYWLKEQYQRGALPAPAPALPAPAEPVPSQPQNSQSPQANDGGSPGNPPAG